MTDEGKREFRNRVLFDLLTTGPVPNFEWTGHAKDRARELVLQGLNPRHLDKIAASCGTADWSHKYASPILRYGDFGVPLTMRPSGLIVAITALPSGENAWRKVYASGLVAVGRERRFA